MDAPFDASRRLLMAGAGAAIASPFVSFPAFAAGRIAPEFVGLDGWLNSGRFGLVYPIAEDNFSATWNAWGNQYWPAEYLVDQRGHIVHSHSGEGGYGETERRIQGLLA